MDAAAKMIGNKVKIMDMDVATIVAAVWHGDWSAHLPAEMRPLWRDDRGHT